MAAWSRPPTLDRLRTKFAAAGVNGVELAQADVLHLDALSRGWSDYDPGVTASMLEYVPPDCACCCDRAGGSCCS